MKADGKFDIESGMTQLPTLPEPRREPTLKSMEACATASGTVFTLEYI